MSKVYRTARGENVDMTVLLSKNEREPALGNVRVNARGDEIDSSGTIVRTRSQIMQDYYNLDTMVPQDGEIPESSGNTHNEVVEDDWVDWEPLSHPQTESEEDMAKKQGTNIGRMIEEQSSTQDTERKPSGGLAAAVAAKKKIVTADVQKTESQQDRENKGVRRI